MGQTWNITLDSLQDATLIAVLQSRGYRVEKERAEDWIKPCALSRSLGQNPNYVSALIARCGGVVPGLELHRARGGRGRVVTVRPSAAFFSFISSRQNPFLP